VLSSVSATTGRTTAWPAPAGGPQFVAIDPNGNLTAKVEDGHSWSYEWNAENQLKRVLKDSVEIARFAYDPLGRRVEKASAGASKTYTYAYEDIIREAQGGAFTRYIHGPGMDEPLASEGAAGELVLKHSDALGSEVRTTDAGGNLVASRSYGTFGQLQIGAGASGHAFTGREWDSETGFYYYRSRYYDPASGRFIAEDSIGLLGGVNLFAYVNDSPAGFRDPWGFDAVTDDPGARACFCELWKQAQYGRATSERAADIVQTAGGGLKCNPWPWLGPGAGSSQGSYQQRPADRPWTDVIAIVHTHPNGTVQYPTPPGASSRAPMGDYDKPRPNYVICRLGVFVAGSGCGAKDVSACTSQPAGPNWYKEFCKVTKK